MKKLLFILLLVTACSEGDDGPVFRIEGNLDSRFNDFAEIAESLNASVPRNNMILRPISDDNTAVNDSKSYKKDGQLYIDIDNRFVDHIPANDAKQAVFQQLANGLFNTPFRDCGIMKLLANENELTGESWGYNDYANLFDPASPCP